MLVKVKNLLIFALISGLIFSGFPGCGTDSDEGEDKTAPPLPPDASMSMDLSAFGGGKMAPGQQPPGKNFKNAALRVLLLDVAIVIVLSPAVTVFKAAKSVEPVKQDDGSWLWSYTMTILGQKYTANLTSQLEPSKVLWSMRVTNPLFKVPLDNFEWYTGETALDNSSGNWRFFDYNTPDMANEIGTIEWSVQVLAESKIVFSSKNPQSQNYGDIVTYSVEGTNALITFFDASENITAEVTWDLVTIAGSIKVPNYNNGERAYWNENKQDVAQ